MYELSVILSAVLEKPDEATLAKIRDFIMGGGGSIKKENVWEKRRLAYPMKKQAYAHYAFFEFEMSAEKLEELQKQLNLSQDILRFLIINKAGIKEEKPRIRPVRPKASAPSPTARVEETRGEKVKIEELDKRLEEILKE